MTEAEFKLKFESLLRYEISEKQIRINLLIEKENVNLSVIIKSCDLLSMKDLRILIHDCEEILKNKYLTKDYSKSFEIFTIDCILKIHNSNIN